MSMRMSNQKYLFMENPMTSTYPGDLHPPWPHSNWRLIHLRHICVVLHEVEVLSEGSTSGVVVEMTVAVNDLQAYPAE